MERDNNAEYRVLSQGCQKHLRSGNLPGYSDDLKKMAGVLLRENKYTDMVKVLMVAFYVDLCGIGCRSYVDPELKRRLRFAVERSGMDEYQVKRLYFDAVRPDTTPRHIMTVSDSLYLLELTLDGRDYEVMTIIANFRLNNRVE